MTQAIIESVRERLERLRAEHATEVDGRVDADPGACPGIHDAAPPGYWDQDFDEMLYDDMGLPR